MSTGSNIKHLRLALAMKQGDLARNLGVSQALLSSVETHRRAPTDRLLSALRFHLGVSPDYFDEQIDFYKPGALLYRQARTGATTANQVAAVFSILAHYARKTYPDTCSDLPEIDVPGASLSLAEVETAAEKTRQYFGIPSGEPVRNVTDLLHQHGIVVVAFPEELSAEWSCDGVSTNDKVDPTVIAMNRNRPGDRYRFSLAHELGHLVLHRENHRSDVPEMEKEANQFAGAFLMPPELVADSLTEDSTLATYAELKGQWGYSIAAIVRRAHDLGIIDDARYRSLRVQISGRGWNYEEPGDVLLENLHTTIRTPFSKPESVIEQRLATVTSLNQFR